MNRYIFTAITLFLALLAPDARAAAPSDVIHEAIDLLTEGLDVRREEFAADEDVLFSFIDGILLPRFDRQFAASAVLTKHWRTATDEQKARFVEAFYITLVHRYAEGLLEFDTDRIEIMPYKGNARKRTTEVKTRVRLDDGTRIPVHYTLVNREDKWRMFDVKIEGVSYVINYRKELDAEIRASSLEKVIQRLETDAGITSNE